MIQTFSTTNSYYVVEEIFHHLAFFGLGTLGEAHGQNPNTIWSFLLSTSLTKLVVRIQMKFGLFFQKIPNCIWIYDRDYGCSRQRKRYIVAEDPNSIVAFSKVYYITSDYASSGFATWRLG